MGKNWGPVTISDVRSVGIVAADVQNYGLLSIYEVSAQKLRPFLFSFARDPLRGWRVVLVGTWA